MEASLKPISRLCQIRMQASADDLDLVKYFQLREAWESKQYEKVGSTELLFLNQARKKYGGARYEGLYCEWKIEIGVLFA